MTTLSERRRSVAFIQKEGESWACFLVTFVAQEAEWHGYFSFRPGHGEVAEDEIRTADIEQTLTIGVHGPKEVYMVLIG